MEFNDFNPRPDSALLMVCCAWPSADSALEAAGAAVGAGYAACCQVGPPVHSIYQWEGKLEQTEEVILTCKTTVAAWPALCAFLRERHPYQVPEIIAWPVSHGLPAYLEWVQANAAGRPANG
jgi:periplasmic divalent cation tolerance protein